MAYNAPNEIQICAYSKCGPVTYGPATQLVLWCKSLCIICNGEYQLRQGEDLVSLLPLSSSGYELLIFTRAEKSK